MPTPVDQKVSNNLNTIKQTIYNKLHDLGIPPNSIQLRSYNDFLRTDTFNLPPNAHAVIPRVRNNIEYYIANYFSIYGFALAMLAFFQPKIGALVAAYIAINAYVLCLHNQPFYIASTRVGITEFKYGTFALTTAILLYIASNQLLHYSFYASLIVLLHALLHNQPIRARANQAAQNVVNTFK